MINESRECKFQRELWSIKKWKWGIYNYSTKIQEKLKINFKNGDKSRP